MVSSYLCEFVMVGKITSNEFLSGSGIAALMGDDKWRSPNTLLTDILAERKVEGIVVTQVEQNEAMEWGDINEPKIIEVTADRLGIDKVTDQVRVPYDYHNNGKKLFSVSLDGILHVERKKTAYTLIYKTDETKDIPPSKRYLKILISAAKENNLSENYVKSLERRPSVYYPLLSEIFSIRVYLWVWLRT